ncbi:DUF465 domain-containing protein [Sulfitobacter sp.]|uniref:DUF465 domain-containing protein n=1 Tax=Sulfitobacter sp. TaxID=1903071 RepID=UPI0030032AAC
MVLIAASRQKISARSKQNEFAPRKPFTARQEALTRMISSLNAQVREEMKRPRPDWLQLRALKAARLKAKDRIIASLDGQRAQQGQVQMSSLQT